ncbi:diguanylate kinase [Oscillatoriales cyanobacterium USR001]|nr:diguanylate kinase [Oscillatoriales cyanobacterium USR001]
MINNLIEKDTPVILVVDDEKSLRVLLRHAMEKQGYQVIEARDGKECLEECSRRLPDIILLDAIMPVMDGFTCCSELQKIFGEAEEKPPNSYLFPLTTKVYKMPPILMITGLDDPESVDRAFAAGATDYVTKPIHWAVLRQRVRRILENGQLIKELQQQNEQERLMARMLERIRYSLNLDVILNTTVHEVRQFLQTDRVLIYRFDTDDKGVMAVESVASPWESVLGKTIYDPCFSEEYTNFYKQGHIQVIEDIYTANISECHKSFLAQFQVRAHMIVPIVIKEQGSRENLGPEMQQDGVDLPVVSPSSQLWGLLIAHHCSQPRRWQPAAIRFVERLATQGSIAIVQSQLYQRLEAANAQLYRLASLDGLTGLANRRQFDEYLNSEWQQSLWDGAPISLILCDVDFFKLYNDTYGHQAGDECLKKVALAIDRSRQQPGDFAARYGGEEFAVILPRTDSQRVLEVAEAIRFRITEMQIPHASSQVSQFVSVSLGVATFVAQESTRVSPVSLETLVKKADQALYRAKQEGRDRVVLQIC